MSWGRARAAVALGVALGVVGGALGGCATGQRRPPEPPGADDAPAPDPRDLPAALVDDVVAVTDPVAARALADTAPAPAGCARDYDGMEVVVVVHPGDPDEVDLSTCEHDVSGSELLRVVAEVLEAVSPGG